MLAYTTGWFLRPAGDADCFGSQRAIEAAVLYLVAHAMFKGALFMVAGLILTTSRPARATSRNSVDLAARMPVHLGRRYLLAALSIGGLPLVLRFCCQGGNLCRARHRPILADASGPECDRRQRADVLAIAFMVGLKPFIGPAGDAPKKAA